MMNLNELLIQYKNISVEILNNLEREEYDVINELFDNRQKIIDDIKSIKYSQDEFKSIVIEHEIEKIEKALYELVNTKKEKVKCKFEGANKNKQANKVYNKMEAGSFIFTKQI